MRVTEDLRRQILKGVMDCVPYVQLSRQFGVSVGSISNIVEEERSKTTDFDALRRLSMMLSRAKLSVLDAAKGAEAAEAISQFGLSLGDLGDYLSLTTKFLAENSLEPSFVGYAVRFMRLSQETGMPYGEVNQDYERKFEGAKTLQETMTQHRAVLSSVTAETEKVKFTLSRMTSRVQRMSALHAGMKKIGLSKLERVVQFVPEFEALGFNAQEVKRFARLELKLKAVNLDPDKLEMYLDERSFLMSQNQDVKQTVEEGRRESQELAMFNQNLRRRNSRLDMIDSAMKTRTILFPCKSCGVPFRVRLESMDFYYDLYASAWVLTVVCPACGYWQQITALDILFQIASLIVPNTE